MRFLKGCAIAAGCLVLGIVVLLVSFFAIPNIFGRRDRAAALSDPGTPAMVPARQGSLPRQTTQLETTRDYEWSVIFKSGPARRVYVSPAGLRDRAFVAQILHALDVQTGSPDFLTVDFFDDSHWTPRGNQPMTDQEMLHWRAQYQRNRHTGFEKFVWLTVRDATSSPPDLKSTEDNIRP